MSSQVAGKVSKEVYYEFFWEVDLDCFNDKKIGDDVLSPTFSSFNHDDEQIDWRLELYPKGISESCTEGYLSLFLRNLTKSEINTNFSLSLLNQNNVKVDNNYNKNVYFFSLCTCGGYKNFVQENFILDQRNNILNNNKFKILCKLSVKEFFEKKEEFVIQLAKNAYRLNKVDRFELLLKNKEFCDVTVVAKEKKFNLHKCILASFSDVFEAMFRSDMKEKNENTVEIEDIRYEVLQELFRFMYTGEVNKINDLVTELLIAAEKYHVVDLKAICEKTMANNLNEDNAIDYFNLANINNAEHLMADVIDWFSLRLESFIFKPEFIEFIKKYPELLVKITQIRYLLLS